MLWQVLKPLLIFPKGLLGGLTGTIIMWIVVIFFFQWQVATRMKRQGVSGPVAISGGWTYLVHMPLVIVLLAFAFGLGFYFITRQ